MGYQQERGGCIQYVYEQGITVDYTEAKLSQWSHLIRSYCDRTNSEEIFLKRIKCRELYIWMAEVSGTLKEQELNCLVNQAFAMTEKVNRKNKKLPPLKISTESNKMIRDYCFAKIMKTIIVVGEDSK